MMESLRRSSRHIENRSTESLGVHVVAPRKEREGGCHPTGEEERREGRPPIQGTEGRARLQGEEGRPPPKRFLMVCVSI